MYNIELAYQLLLCIPISKTIKVVERLSPLLHRDIISVSYFYYRTLLISIYIRLLYLSI
jgi:hypothetical protein